jgi:DNA-binding transcriptional LysR family regulator
VMKKFLAAHPQVQLRLEYRRTDQIYEACLAGELDFGIVAQPVRRPQLEVVPLREEELLVVCPPEHPLARRRPLSLRALEGQPFIAFDPDIPTRKLIDGMLRRRGVKVALAMELDNIETIKRSVEAGLGLSILPAPALAHERQARTLVARQPQEGPLRRAVGVIARRGREVSPAARSFLRLLQEELGADPVR